jgi:sarcosine oxidase gamma subunit
VAAGAKLVPFAGWEMPVQYTGIREEHLAVRSACGMFDVSHMGEIETSGPQATELLQRLLSNDVEQLAVGGAQYSLLCREDGGVLDDLFTYRLAPDRYLTVTNASNHERDLAWFREHAAGFDATVDDALDRYAMLAVQGPAARELVQAIADRPLPSRMTGRAARAGRAPGARLRDRLHGRGRRRAHARPRGRARGLGRARAARRRPGRPGRARHRCASRSASTSTATTSWRSAGRSRRAWAGPARRTPASSAPRPSARSATPALRSGSWPSAWTVRASPGRGTPSPAAAR